MGNTGRIIGLTLLVGAGSLSVLVAQEATIITPHMFLDALSQYHSTVKEIASTIRFNFIYKPLSDLFLVYNERRSSTGEVRERALIAKFTYVFDF